MVLFPLLGWAGLCTPPVYCDGGGIGVVSAIELAPDAEKVQVDPAGPQGRPPAGDDLSIFRNNTADRPDVSAEALLRILSGLPQGEVETFRRTHCGKIVELLTSLDRAASSTGLDQKRYAGITSELGAFGIPTIQARERSGPPPARRMHERRDPVEALVDVRITANSGDKEKTAAAIDETRAAYPDNPSVQTAAASYYNEAHDYKKAETTATDAIALDSKNSDAYKARALARASLEDRKGAIEDIQKAMAMDPQDESASVLAALLESRKPVTTLKSISSVAEIKRALGISEDAPDAVRGGTDAGGGDAGGGAGLSAPDFSRSRAYLKTALAKNRLGDYESAQHYASLAIEKDPANYEAYLERANAYNFLGRYDDSVRDAGFVIEKAPANLQAYNMRSWALNRKGQAREAQADASRAIGINPGFADAWFNRALAYEKQGDYRKMLDDFKQAAALSGAYSSRYQDAVAQYGAQVPGFAAGAAGMRAAAAVGGGEAPARRRHSPFNRFLMTLLFTVTGGGLVAMGLIHIFSSRRGEDGVEARATHPDVLAPSIFYEGVATGKYKIERKLGEGAMGVVYEATDQSLGRKVAIKRMGEEIKINEREKQRFLEEARTVALLRHPNIIEIYTIFEEEDNIYLVFEYVDGVTLDKVLDEQARMPFETAAAMFGETAGALAYAHSKGVVHRDLKLSNIMLSSEGSIKVMDFGLARHAQESMARLSNKEVVGSPAYMAPEQDLGASSVESDIYSLGVCLYEALSGVLPFQGPDFHYQKNHKAYQALSDILPGLPPGVDEVVSKCLAPEPEGRFRSAEEFRRALGALL